MLDYSSSLPASYSVDDGGEGFGGLMPVGSLSPPQPGLGTQASAARSSMLPYHSALSSAGAGTPAKQRRRVAGAPRRRVGGAPSAAAIQRRRSNGADMKLSPLGAGKASGAADTAAESADASASAASAAGVTAVTASTLPPPLSSPFRPRRVSLAASPAIRHIADGNVGATSSPSRRRIKGAPKPMRRRKGPSAFSAAASVMTSSKYAVNSTKANMEKFREEMDKGMPQVPDSPKGAQKWGRVKQRVQWQEGDSCAVCMSRELTGRVKPCGHRSMCEACYREVLGEGRGVYCPSCFAEVKRLVPDSMSSSDDPNGSDTDTESGWESFGSPLANRSQAKLHLRASMAGTKLDRPELCGTTAVEIAQAFGTGIGTVFLHLSILFVLMLVLSVLSLPTILANTGGVRSLNRQSLNPSPLVSTTLGNCGSTSCNVGEKWYVVVIDAAALSLLGVLAVWTRARIAVFQAQVGDNILDVAQRTVLVQNLNANLITAEDVERYFVRMTGILVARTDFLFDVEARELALMQRRRVVATQLRIADAKIEWGDETSSCAGECVSEEEIGHLMKPRLERKLAKIERKLQEMESSPTRFADAFVWFETEQDRDRAMNSIARGALPSPSSFSRENGDQGRSCGERITRSLGCANGGCLDVERSMGGYAGCLSRCLSCSPGGQTYPLSGSSRGDGMSESTVHAHPALFPANIVHKNMGISVGERLSWRIAAVVLLIVVVGLSTAIFHSVHAPRGGGAASIANRNILQAVLLLTVNACVPPIVRVVVHQQRPYLRTEENDAACALSLIVTAINVLYFALYSAMYNSGDGGLARWENMFSTHWYDEGGGDVMHYYMLFDAGAGPLLIAARVGYQKWTRQAKLSKAVCQEQLNQVHVGIQLDFLCEYSTALVTPAVAIVLSCGLPLLPAFAALGLVVKTFVLRYVLFYEAAVPLWRDGMLVRWGCGVVQVAVLMHFFFASAMIVGADQVDFVATDGEQLRSGGLYIVHPFALLGVTAFMIGARCVAACVGRKLLRRTGRNSKVLDVRNRNGGGLSSRFGGDKLPGTKEARVALERVRMEREAALQQASDSEDSAPSSDRGSSSSDDDEEGGGEQGRSGRKYHEDMTNGDEFKMYLELLDEQAERAWSADLVVDPEQYDSFDAAHHPFFGAEVGLRRSVRSVARGRARRAMIDLQRRESEISRLEQETANREDKALSARQKVISHKLMSAHGGVGGDSPSKKSGGDSAAQSRKEAQAAEAKKRLMDYMARAKKIKAKRKSLKADSRRPRGRQKYGGQNFVA